MISIHKQAKAHNNEQNKALTKIIEMKREYPSITHPIAHPVLLDRNPFEEIYSSLIHYEFTKYCHRNKDSNKITLANFHPFQDLTYA
jgi:hypothetical protein